MRTENERFRAAKSIINLMGPKLVFFSVIFFSFHFRDMLQSRRGSHFRLTSSIETGVWIWVSTHRGRQQALRYAEKSNSTKAASIFQASNKIGAACCALLLTQARLRHHHEPLGRGSCDCVEQLRCCVTIILASSRTRRVVAV